MENPLKVQAKLAELNRDLNPPQWVVVEGYHAINAFKFGYNGQPAQFLGGVGMPVKVFINNATGEVKLFIATLFEG